MPLLKALAISAALAIGAVLGTSVALADESNASVSDASGPEWTFEFLPDDPIKDGIYYFPYVQHTLHDADTGLINLVGIVFEQYSAGTFRNSFGDQTFYVVRGLNLAKYGPFGLEIYAGAMYGYYDNLATGNTIPDSFKFLFENDVVPIAAITAYYEVNDRFEFRVLGTPFFGSVGFKINF